MKQTCRVVVEVEYDDEHTDPDGVATALDDAVRLAQEEDRALFSDYGGLNVHLFTAVKE